jgi:hypothetical protein
MVTVESFLQFITIHNAAIIEILIAVVLLTALFLGTRWFLAAKEPEAHGTNLGDLEESLKKIIAQAGAIPAAGAVAAAGGNEESQKLSTEIAKLKSDLQAKQKEIEGMASQAALAVSSGEAQGPGMSSEDKSKLEGQVKELEAKLAEYEIISEDIADLSFYKEQNAELQKQVEALKGGGAVPEAAVAPAEAKPAAPAGPEPTITGKSKVAEATAAAEATPAAPESEPAPAAALETPEPAAEPVAAPAAEAPAAVENTVDDSLLAGFDEAAKSQAPSAEFDMGQMDVDKMLSEAAEIKTPGDEVDIEKELAGGVDEDKLLKEASALDAVTPEDKRLMGQFENFVKKGE